MYVQKGAENKIIKYKDKINMEGVKGDESRLK